MYKRQFIDCPPSLGLLTINSLTAVDSVLIPLQCEFYALEGVSQLMSTIEIVKKNMNPNLKIQGVILSMFDGRTNLSVKVVEEVKKYFKAVSYTHLQRIIEQRGKKPWNSWPTDLRIKL